MLKTLRFPLIYLVELLIWLPLLAGGAIVASFLAATPIASLDLQGKSLPATWEAAVANHGQYFEGFLVSSHPALFGLDLTLVAAAATALYQVHKAQATQREASGAAHKTAYSTANLLVAVAIMATAYCVYKFALTSVALV